MHEPALQRLKSFVDLLNNRIGPIQASSWESASRLRTQKLRTCVLIVQYHGDAIAAVWDDISVGGTRQGESCLEAVSQQSCSAHLLQRGPVPRLVLHLQTSGAAF